MRNWKVVHHKEFPFAALFWPAVGLIGLGFVLGSCAMFCALGGSL